jgi:hypothetical protein
MALAIKDSKVVYVSPPQKLGKKEMKALEESQTNKKLIKKAISRKYRVE